MAAKCSIVPDIVWNIVIEALASFEQVDISTLIGLVKLAPVISGDAGKDAREMVSLRILESLFDHGNEATVGFDSTKNPKVSFDASERCEHVLDKILRETPEQMTKLEKEKWDIHPFLTQKRSSLPKSLLKKLKEAILDSRHPLLTSLKEKSKLETANVSEDISPVINDGQAKDDSALNTRIDKDKFEENVWQEADQVGTSTGGTTENARREEREMIIENPPGSSGNKSMDQHGAHANSQHQDEDDQHQQVHCKDDYMPQDQRLSADGMENLVSVVKCNDPPKSIVELNNERADDERTDIAAKKEAFLKSQCTMSQDFLAMTEMSEIDLCMKCNEGGQLLVCSSDACPLQVHESCLGLDVTFDENGKFFCPFCAYSCAISKYLEAKQKVSLARKNLQAFSSFKVKHGPNKPCMKQSELEKNEGRQMGVFCETTVEASGHENVASRAGNINCMSSDAVDSNLPDPLIPDVDDPSVQKTTDLPQNPIPEPSTPKQNSKKKESQRSTEPSCSRELRKRKSQCTPPPPIPLLRRRKLQWTKSEEEALKEGVERFAGANNNKGIPWKEILDFGRNVFHKGRTTIDLKDKWRNICKGSPSA